MKSLELKVNTRMHKVLLSVSGNLYVQIKNQISNNVYNSFFTTESRWNKLVGVNNQAYQKCIDIFS